MQASLKRMLVFFAINQSQSCQLHGTELEKRDRAQVRAIQVNVSSTQRVLGDVAAVR